MSLLWAQHLNILIMQWANPILFASKLWDSCEILYQYIRCSWSLLFEKVGYMMVNEHWKHVPTSWLINYGIHAYYTIQSDCNKYIYNQSFNTIHMYSGITSGRVLNGELLYTEILEVNLFAFAYRLFHRDFSPINGTLQTYFLWIQGIIFVSKIYNPPTECFAALPIYDNIFLGLTV